MRSGSPDCNRLCRNRLEPKQWHPAVCGKPRHSQWNPSFDSKCNRIKFGAIVLRVMKRIFINSLSFATTLAIGVSIPFFLLFLRSGGGDISALTIAEDVPVMAPAALPETSPESPIRRVDFANFTYASYFVGEVGGFKLRDGELLPKRRDKIGRPLDMSLVLASVAYGDVNGDGAEEAIIDLGWETGGTAIPDLIYVYGLDRGKPKLLWAFETGDRADGGYKNVFAENGELVIELYGKDKIIGRDLYAEDGTSNGTCCPTYFTRTRYKWANNHFRQQGEPEALPVAAARGKD